MGVHPALAALLQHAPVLTDGAWGTELQKRGLPPGQPPESWNLTHPDQVRAAARAYVEAGSEIILTNTFGANRIRLADAGLAEEVGLLNRRGVELSREAAGSRAAVFASIGPTGKLLMAGEVTAEDVRAAFEEQATALAEAGADALVIETMSDLQEAQLALAAAKATGLPVVVCMVFDSGRERDRTLMGDPPELVARTLEAAGADVLGANCGQGIEGFLPICRRLRAASSLPLWIKPNAGLPQLMDGRPRYTTTPESFAAHAPALRAAGADFLGGCCGTDPEFIRALRRVLDRA
ncbi:homocysteine S-methyltransferase family protein [Limisphaera sp. VF-2]|uniref:homocysteine S-methyltransferase family protein n=1 Tax=Limisphaera sp. VF-2 TaxID=3400418 RepID=UPI0017720BE9